MPRTRFSGRVSCIGKVNALPARLLLRLYYDQVAPISFSFIQKRPQSAYTIDKPRHGTDHPFWGVAIANYLWHICTAVSVLHVTCIDD